MSKKLFFISLGCALFSIACNVDSTAKSKFELVPNERVVFKAGCTPNGTLPNSLWGCYIAGTPTAENPLFCANAQKFLEHPQTQDVLIDCNQQDKVFAIWIEIEMGSTPGIMPGTIDKWLELTQDTITYMKNSSQFNNETIETSITKMASYADQLINDLDNYNAAGKAKEAVLTNNLKNKITDKFRATLDVEKAELVDLRYNVNQMNPIIDEYEKQANQQTDYYLSAVKVYDAYKKTGGMIAATLKQQSLDASATEDFDQLARIKMGVVAISRNENARIVELLVEIHKLQYDMENIQSSYEQKVQPYISWMQANGYPIPDLLTVALASLTNMTTYLQERKTYVNTVATKLAEGIENRTKSLILVKAEKDTRETILQEAHLRRATDFANQLNAKIKDMWALPAKSKKLKLSLLRPQYDKFVSILSYEKMCQTVLAPQASVSWMVTGCNLLRVEFSKAKNFLKDGLPFAIIMDIDSLRSAGIDTAMLTQIQSLSVSNLAEATRLHDIAVMSTEVRNDEERR